MQNLQEAVEQERALREAAQRERDKNNSEKLALQNSITSYEEEIIQLKRKIDRLNEEIDDYVSSGKTDAEVSLILTFFRPFYSWQTASTTYFL